MSDEDPPFESLRNMKKESQPVRAPRTRSVTWRSGFGRDWTAFTSHGLVDGGDFAKNSPGGLTQSPLAFPGTGLAAHPPHDDLLSSHVAVGVAHPCSVRSLQLRAAARGRQWERRIAGCGRRRGNRNLEFERHRWHGRRRNREQQRGDGDNWRNHGLWRDEHRPSDGCRRDDEHGRSDRLRRKCWRGWGRFRGGAEHWRYEWLGWGNGRWFDGHGRPHRRLRGSRREGALRRLRGNPGRRELLGAGGLLAHV